MTKTTKTMKTTTMAVTITVTITMPMTMAITMAAAMVMGMEIASPILSLNVHVRLQCFVLTITYLNTNHHCQLDS